MLIELKVPDIGDAEVVTVSEWHVNSGDAVEEGTLLATLEAAKASFEVIAPDSGIVKETIVAAGAEVAVGDLLAVLELVSTDDIAILGRDGQGSGASAPGGFAAPNNRARSMAYDVVVIGGGPGGYVAAIRSAQLGLRTACVDGRRDDSGKPVLGGVCLNVGCIPSKALLDSSHVFELIKKHSAKHGVVADEARIDVSKMMARKDSIVSALTNGIASLFKKHSIDWYKGHGRLVGAQGVVVDGDPDAEDTQLLATKGILLATGSKPRTVPFAEVDGERIVDSDGALAFSSVPRHLCIIGAGYIGLELGSVWRRLGSKVTILEAMDSFLPLVDREIAQQMARIMEADGVNIQLGAKVNATVIYNDAVEVSYEVNGGTETLRCDRVVVAIGRQPNTAGLGLEEVGVKSDDAGFIEIDRNFETSVPNIFAIGDVTRGPMLAHRASEDGVLVTEFIAEKRPCEARRDIAAVIYTWPEIAWVGDSEQALRSAGRAYKLGKFPFLASGRAKAMGETRGFVKVISDPDSNRILGVHILGPNASELIMEAVAIMHLNGTTKDVESIVHAHPTLAEAFHEAVMSVNERALHI